MENALLVVIFHLLQSLLFIILMLDVSLDHLMVIFLLFQNLIFLFLLLTYDLSKEGQLLVVLIEFPSLPYFLCEFFSLLWSKVGLSILHYPVFKFKLLDQFLLVDLHLQIQTVFYIIKLLHILFSFVPLLKTC